MKKELSNLPILQRIRMNGQSGSKNLANSLSTELAERQIPTFPQLPRSQYRLFCEALTSILL